MKCTNCICNRKVVCPFAHFRCDTTKLISIKFCTEVFMSNVIFMHVDQLKLVLQTKRNRTDHIPQKCALQDCNGYGEYLTYREKELATCHSVYQIETDASALLAFVELYLPIKLTAASHTQLDCIKENGTYTVVVRVSNVYLKHFSRYYYVLIPYNCVCQCLYLI